MTTAVAAAPIAAPLAPAPVESSSPSALRSYAAIAPSNNSSHSATPGKSTKPSSNHGSSSPSEGSSQPRLVAEGKRSPNSTRGAPAPKIIVKKEPPSSPDLPTGRHRPRRLDLSTNTVSSGSGALTARPSGPLTGKDSAGLAMHDVGLACLSPGFHTHDPAMREQLQRSMDVRERQRQLIEARQKTAKTSHNEGDEARNGENPFRNGMKTPGTSRRKGPPPGLSIAPPSHSQFANERVIQSAPLNQSFTGLRNGLHPLSRQVVNQPQNLSQTSHIHHVPANQTNNRLPPISDVFASETLGRHQDSHSRSTVYNYSPGNSSHSNNQPPLPSPGFPPSHHQQGPPTSRPREYKSAEEAVQSLSGGREELLPRIVHYGGHQPPTPPSPMPSKSNNDPTLGPMGVERNSTSRRRGRDEYERDMGTPPLGRQESRRSGPFGEGRDSPETQRKKKEEFIALCARAWDLFHS